MFKHFEKAESAIEKLDATEYTNRLINIAKIIKVLMGRIIATNLYELVVVKDKEEIDNALNSISDFPLIGNKKLLLDLAEASRENGKNKVEIAILKLVHNDLSTNEKTDRGFFPIQFIDKGNGKKYIEGLGGWFVESKEIFTYTFSEKEIFRYLANELFKNIEKEDGYKALLGNTASQMTKQMRFNYFGINTSNINSIDEYFSLIKNKKKRNRARATLKNLKNSKDIVLKIDKIDETFDIEGFLKWGIEAAKNNGKELLNHHTVYEKEGIMAYIKNGQGYNLSIDFKGKKIIDYIVVVIDGIMFDITGQMDNTHITDEADKRLTDEVSRYLIFQRIILALKLGVGAIFEGPGNFGRKKYACNISSFVYYLNED